MLGFVLRRLAVSLVVVLLAAATALVVTRLAPGDMTSELVGSGASASAIAAERVRLGLDRSPGALLVDWLSGVARLDLGTSLLYGRPVAALVLERTWHSAVLAASAIVTATLLGIPLGVLAGAWRGPWSAVIRLVSIGGLSVPPLVSSLALVWLAARTGWFPLGGMSDLATASGTWAERTVDLARHLVVPVLALAIPLMATLERLQARAIADTLREPYIVAGRARGIKPRWLIWRHAFRPALLPVVAVAGMVLGTLLSGSFVVEIITAWPGLGRLMFDALRARDLELVAGCALAGGVGLSLGILLSDLGLAWLDPRLRERARGAS